MLRLFGRVVAQLVADVGVEDAVARHAAVERGVREKPVVGEEPQRERVDARSDPCGVLVAEALPVPPGTDRTLRRRRRSARREGRGKRAGERNANVSLSGITR